MSLSQRSIAIGTHLQDSDFTPVLQSPNLPTVLNAVKERMKRRQDSVKLLVVVALLLAFVVLVIQSIVGAVSSSFSTNGEITVDSNETAPGGWTVGNITLYPENASAVSLDDCRSCCYWLNEDYDGNKLKSDTVSPPDDDLLHYFTCIYFGCEAYEYNCSTVTDRVNNNGEPHKRNNSVRGCEVGQSIRTTGECVFEPPDRIAETVLHIPTDLVLSLQCINGTIVDITNLTTLSPTAKVPTQSPTQSPTQLPTKSPTLSPTTKTKSPTTRITKLPTQSPTTTTTITQSPTTRITKLPTLSPTKSPNVETNTFSPTLSPNLSENTSTPTTLPLTLYPTLFPTVIGGADLVQAADPTCDTTCIVLSAVGGGMLASVLIAGVIYFKPIKELELEPDTEVE